MTLHKGKAHIARKIKTLLEEGKPKAQAAAIAYSMAGKKKKKASMK